MPRTRQGRLATSQQSDDFQPPAPSTATEPTDEGSDNASTSTSVRKPRGPHPWLTIARGEDGVREAPGSRHNPRILEYFEGAHHPEILNDETAWCAAFVGFCLENAGYRSTRNLMAKPYLQWGKATTMKIGAIAVLDRGKDPRFGHVGFVVGWNATHVYLLGGNQSNAVNVTKFPKSQVRGYRWPVTLLNSRTAQGGAAAGTGTVLNTTAELLPDPTPLTGVTDPGTTLQETGGILTGLGEIKWWLAAIGTALILGGVAWMLYARWRDYQDKGR